MNKKIKICALLLSISLMGFGQELPKDKSVGHKQIKGTNIFMIPPISFESSNNFKGFQNPKDQSAMIIVVEIPGPYSEVSKGFTAAMLEKAGMVLKTKKEIKVDEFKGLFLELDHSTDGMEFSKKVLLYGNEKASTIINGIYMKDSLLTGEKIKESILSTVIDSSLQIDPREALDYSLNEKVGSLKFKAVMGNGMLFDNGLKTLTDSEEKTTLITDKSFAKAVITDKKMFCILRLKNYPEEYSLIEEKGINEIEIDLLKGFELYAKKKGNANEEIYQIILFDDNGGYYLLLGSYKTGNIRAVSDLKNVMQTFKRKN